MSKDMCHLGVKLGVCVGRLVNNSIMSQEARVDLFSGLRSARADRRGSDQYVSWKGGLWL